MADLAVHTTAIPGLLLVDLPLHHDPRGWFKENWQRAKMTALGLPDFGPVQHSVAWNSARGVTRGFHAEPWDKFVSVVHGRVCGAWVDLREGPSFGQVVTLEMGTDKAVFVPRGVGNAYQTLSDDTVYSYLVNAHWSAAAKQHYTFTNLALPGVAWPIPLTDAVISEADEHHPVLADVTPAAAHRPLVVGSAGQVGRALCRLLPEAVGVDRDELDITDAASVDAFDFSTTSAIINAAAFTAVDAAEGDSRAQNWAVNAVGPANLARAARAHRLPLVHLSSDYVFDGSRTEHDEDEPFSPLGAYGAAKAAGDLAVAGWQQHYLVRTSWVVGEGHNFVRTMARLAREGASPAVVDDQVGRLSFADDLARGIFHLLEVVAPFGTYNLTGDGTPQTWFQVAREVYALVGSEGQVSATDTASYGQGRSLAPRPQHSTLTLDKIKATGFVPRDQADSLRAYLQDQP
ncbi:sugar nucleotide-binding protein [Aestuariimicrobium ganziense]|uniref:sugar nucleotide-binding protein n=1 Tax=Aestuariimicrobium ganziense TaxID=2773677 RepID=UPI0019421CF0|nr:sugar nucleotide-binding protein [Aestuariimicrobium ganziense]